MSDEMVLMKSTQNGISEFLIVYSINECINGRNIFYVLPTEQIMYRFVRNRFEKSVAFTPYYAELKKKDDETGKRKTESMSLKDIAKGTIAFVGSNSAAPFTEFPADTLVIDEYDQCNFDNLYMAEERLSHSDLKRKISVSQPTIQEIGIHSLWLKSNQQEWYIKHDCGKWINPDFFTHVVKRNDNGDYLLKDSEWSEESNRDIFPICEYCNKPFNRYSDGEWVVNHQSNISGRHITKMFSANMTLLELLTRFEDGLSNPSAMQRFYNGDLGLPYRNSGNKISVESLNDCRGDYILQLNDIYYASMVNDKDFIFAGIDVGGVYDVTIFQLTPERKSKLIYVGELQNTQDVIDVLKMFKVKIGLIDSMPETREARRIAATIKGIFLCQYGNVIQDKINYQSKVITTNRTQALDAVLEAILLKNIELPANAQNIKNLYPQLVSSTRVFDDEKQVYKWVESSADHKMHSFSYAMIAKRLMLQIKS